VHSTDLLLGEEARRGEDHLFGEGCRLDEEKPVEVSGCKDLVCSVEHGESRTYIKDDSFSDGFGMVNAYGVGNTGPTVVGAKEKAGMAEVGHDCGGWTARQ